MGFHSRNLCRVHNHCCCLLVLFSGAQRTGTTAQSRQDDDDGRTEGNEGKRGRIEICMSVKSRSAKGGGRERKGRDATDGVHKERHKERQLMSNRTHNTERVEAQIRGRIESTVRFLRCVKRGGRCGCNVLLQGTPWDVPDIRIPSRRHEMYFASLKGSIFRRLPMSPLLARPPLHLA